MISVFNDSIFHFIPPIPFFSLSASANICGQVRDSDIHLPIAHAKVEIIRGNHIITSVLTHADGNYMVSELEPKSYIVKVTQSDFESKFQLVDLAFNQTLHVDFALRHPPGKVSGQVTHALTGQPISNATIDILEKNVLVDFAESNEEGTYTLSKVAPGRYEIKVTAPHFQVVSQNITLESHENLEAHFVLEPLGSITGCVMHAFTGQPIVGASVGLWQNHALFASTHSDDQGCFRLNGVGKCQLVVQFLHFHDLEKSIEIPCAQMVASNFSLIYIEPLPPKQGYGQVIYKTFTHHVNRIHCLKWKPSPDPSVVSYRIYRHKKYIAEISARDPLIFKDEGRRKKDKIYAITAVNHFGQESISSLSISIPAK